MTAPIPPHIDIKARSLRSVVPNYLTLALLYIPLFLKPFYLENFSLRPSQDVQTMGNDNIAGGNSWLNVVKKAFRSPTKSAKSSKRSEEREQEDDQKVIICLCAHT